MKRILLLCSAFVATLLAQESNVKSAFISANLGGFIIAHNDFEKVYDSKFGFAPGISLGFPLSSKLYLLGKATYFSKSGVPVIATYSYDTTAGWVKTTERKEGTASFREWLINVGLHYNIFLTESYTLGIHGGAVFTFLSEEQNTPASGSSTLEGSGMLGYFGGVSIERDFEDSPFTLFAETEYNLSRNDIKSFVGDYGGLNLTVGVRYYFKDRRKQ